MDKLLIIAYYWPPDGGAGVQRWLKLTSYLADMGIEVHVVTVDPNEASYMITDPTLIKDVNPKVNVHLTKSFEPVNMYAKMVGKSKVPVAGFTNVDNTNWKQKLVNFIRSNLFIPDPRKGWSKYAINKASELIEKHNIKHVVTTSPPHSVQVTGLKLKKRFGDKIKWIADFRDPWTDIYYYKLLNHSAWSHKINAKYERLVVENSDLIVTAGKKFEESYRSKTNKVSDNKFKVIQNGFDPKDFENVEKTSLNNPTFTITYTGTISDHYQPEVFFEALAMLTNKYPDGPIKFNLVGIISDSLKDFIVSKIGDRAQFRPPVTHGEAIANMLDAHVLLLITQGTEGTIPGKTFEYLASQNRIVCVGTGDAGKALDKCEAGKSFERHQKEDIFNYLDEAYHDFLNKVPFNIKKDELVHYSRPGQAAALVEFIK